MGEKWVDEEAYERLINYKEKLELDLAEINDEIDAYTDNDKNLLDEILALEVQVGDAETQRKQLVRRINMNVKDPTDV